MTNKRTHGPKEGLVEPEEIGPGEHFLDTSDDVQGHGFPNTAPPASFTKKGVGHGGELQPGDTNPESEG